jgi:hypothetical protein
MCKCRHFGGLFYILLPLNEWEKIRGHLRAENIKKSKGVVLNIGKDSASSVRIKIFSYRNYVK